MCGLSGLLTCLYAYRALESSLSPIVIFATNRGICTIRGACMGLWGWGWSGWVCGIGGIE